MVWTPQKKSLSFYIHHKKVIYFVIVIFHSQIPWLELAVAVFPISSLHWSQNLALGLGGGNETRARGLVSAGAGIAKRLLEWGYAGFASGPGSAASMSTTERAGFLHLSPAKS